MLIFTTRGNQGSESSDEIIQTLEVRELGFKVIPLAVKPRVSL